MQLRPPSFVLRHKSLCQGVSVDGSAHLTAATHLLRVSLAVKSDICACRVAGRRDGRDEALDFLHLLRADRRRLRSWLRWIGHTCER